MKDNPKDRRFYLTDSTAGVIDLAKGMIADTMSPCVVMESDVNGYLKGGLLFRTYPIYFFVRAKMMKDADAAAVAKEKAVKHAMNFLAWIRQKHDNDPTPSRDFERINLEDIIDIQTAGPLENGWFAVLVQLERCESVDMCVDEDLYPEDEELYQDEQEG